MRIAPKKAKNRWVSLIRLVYNVHQQKTLNCGLARYNLTYKKYKNLVARMEAYIGSKRGKNFEIVKAIKKVLSKIPPFYSQRKLCPRDYFVYSTIAGVQSGVIKRFGQQVYIKKIEGYNSGKMGFVEIFDELTDKYCGIAHQSDLEKISFQPQKNDARWLSILEGLKRKPSIELGPEQQKELELDRQLRRENDAIAKILKERSEQRRQYELERELEEKRRREERKQREQENVQNLERLLKGLDDIDLELPKRKKGETNLDNLLSELDSLDI